MVIHRSARYEQERHPAKLPPQTAIEATGDDIRRDNATSADGIRTLRYGWLDVTQHPCQVAAEVALALSVNGFQDARPCAPGCPVGQLSRGQSVSRSGPLPGNSSA